ncbi:MAG TPA: glycosyltransferase family 4 protein [Pseudolabrys sp.]|nr:glycosyltransferase family 4 protein [Pseudolabrys sp.]
MPPLNILHVFRTPTGGLFRHVLDLSRAQVARGHRVGIIADSSTGGPRADEAFREIAPHLVLGVTRLPMRRNPHPSDLVALFQVMRKIAQTDADVIHCHGAKGGVYGRLAMPKKRALRVYTPHGGSLHYSKDTLSGRINLAVERLLMLRTDLFLFESIFSSEEFHRKIGDPGDRLRVVCNGISPPEFEPVAIAPDASDLLFLGELRDIKGVDILIDAIAQLHNEGRPVTATLVGDGPDRAAFVAQAERLGVANSIRFMAPMPARQAQALGRIMVFCSRAESLPYVVLEAAASAKPMISTKVGGIPEIYGPFTNTLIPKEDPGALAAAIARSLDNPAEAADLAKKVSARVAASFSLDAMVDGVLAGYQAGFARMAKSRE